MPLLGAEPIAEAEPEPIVQAEPEPIVQAEPIAEAAEGTRSDGLDYEDAEEVLDDGPEKLCSKAEQLRAQADTIGDEIVSSDITTACDCEEEQAAFQGFAAAEDGDESSSSTNTNAVQRLYSADKSSSEDESKDVYKMPSSIQESFLFWPANFVVLAVAWQLRMLFGACSLFIAVSAFLFGMAANPAQKTATLKQHLRQRMKPIATDLLPQLGKLSKKIGWGLLAVAYVSVMLGILILPVICFEAFFISNYIEEPLDVTAPLHLNYTEPRPSASLRLPSPSGISTAATDMKPFSWTRIHLSVALVLPESDHNRNLGMFQVTGELYSMSELLERSSRPCMLRYQSAPIRHMKMLMYSVPLLLDMSGETQTLRLDLINLQRESGKIYVSRARVVIEPRAGFGPGDGLPEIYAAEVRIRSELPWKKSMLHRWKWTFYVWTAAFLFMGEVLVVLCCFRGLLLPSVKAKKQHQQPTSLQTRRSRSPSHVKKRVTFQEA